MVEQDNRGPRERIYDEQISSMMEKILAICQEHKLPFVATFELDVSPDRLNGDPLMCSTVLADEGVKSQLIRDLAKVVTRQVHQAMQKDEEAFS